MNQAYRRWKEVLAETPAGEPVPVPPQPLPQPETSGAAIASLVLGIVSFFAGPLTAVPAVIFGHTALKRIHKSGGMLTGGGLAIAGLVTAYVSTALLVFAVIYICEVFFVGKAVMEQGLNQVTRLAQRDAALELRQARQAGPPVRLPRAHAPAPVHMPARAAATPDVSEQVKKNEAALRAALDELVAAQRDFHKRTGRYAGSAKSLGIHKIVNNTYAGYAIKMIGLSTSFRITAEPLLPGQTGNNRFQIDASGVIHSEPTVTESRRRPTTP